jgi:hypothetical protein
MTFNSHYTMKKILLAILALFAPAAAFAVIPVTVDAIVDPNFLLSQAAQVANMAGTLAQAEQIVGQGVQMYELGQQMKNFAGDPKIAVSGLVDLRSINTYVNNSIGNGDLNALASTFAQAQGGVNIRLNLVAGDPGSVANDNAAMISARIVIGPDGRVSESPAELYTSLDSAEAIARSIKFALIAQNNARAQAGQALIQVNLKLGSAQNESQKQAAAAQLAAIQAQQTLLNGQTQQQALEYQLQKDKDERTAENANITDQEQATTDSQAIGQQIATTTTTAQQNQAASRNTVPGNPMNLDYSQIH